MFSGTFITWGNFFPWYSLWFLFAKFINVYLNHQSSFDTRCNMVVWSSLPLSNSGKSEVSYPTARSFGMAGKFFLPTSQPATDTCSDAALQLYHTSNPSRNVVAMPLRLSKVILLSILLNKQHAKLNSGVKRHAVAFLSVLSLIITCYRTFLIKKH